MGRSRRKPWKSTATLVITVTSHLSFSHLLQFCNSLTCSQSHSFTDCPQGPSCEGPKWVQGAVKNILRMPVEAVAGCKTETSSRAVASSSTQSREEGGRWADDKKEMHLWPHHRSRLKSKGRKLIKSHSGSTGLWFSTLESSAQTHHCPFLR
jgi:hypothetical protein